MIGDRIELIIVKEYCGNTYSTAKQAISSFTPAVYVHLECEAWGICDLGLNDTLFCHTAYSTSSERLLISCTFLTRKKYPLSADKLHRIQFCWNIMWTISFVCDIMLCEVIDSFLLCGIRGNSIYQNSITFSILFLLSGSQLL